MTGGRPREFDREATLETIMQVFWKHGFEGTTKRELMEATGVASQSLYNAFGDKHAMFREALDHYAHTRVTEVRSFLDQPGLTPFDSLRAFVAMWADLPEEFHRGCLLCNTSAQVDPESEPEISNFVRGHLVEMREMFIEVLARAEVAGELRDGADVPAIASTLMCTANGIALLYRIEAPQELLRDTVRGTLHSLDAERAPREE